MSYECILPTLWNDANKPTTRKNGMRHKIGNNRLESLTRVVCKFMEPFIIEYI